MYYRFIEPSLYEGILAIAATKNDVLEIAANSNNNAYVSGVPNKWWKSCPLESFSISDNRTLIRLNPTDVRDGFLIVKNEFLIPLDGKKAFIELLQKQSAQIVEMNKQKYEPLVLVDSTYYSIMFFTVDATPEYY